MTTTKRRTQRSPEARAWQWMYSTPQWLARRHTQLRHHPLCKRCLEQGRIVAATVVHHTTPHKGDYTLFMQGEVASSCKPCHDSIEQSIERLGYEKGNDDTGQPIDPQHPWNKKKTGGE